MSSRYNFYYIISAFVILIAGNYLLSFNSDSYIDEAVLISSLALVGLLYIFILSRLQKSMEKLASLSVKVRENEYFREMESDGRNNDVAVVETFTNYLLTYIQQSIAFVNAVKDGKLTSEEALETRYPEGSLMHALQELRTQIVELNEDEQERKWVSEGMTKFVEILRKSNQSAEDFYDSIITGLVKYLDANQGSLFVSTEDEGRKILKQVSCYAYNRKKFLEKEVEMGQGLVGQVFLEKETTFLKEIPKDYVRITSGLGEAPPRNLLLVPFKLNDQVECIIELASFHEFRDYQIEFLEKVGENIASTISAFKINESTKRLLEESQHQSEVMQAQEEELRQNMEELEATQENLERESMAKAKEKYLMDALMANATDYIYFKDQESKFIRMSEHMLQLFNAKTLDDVVGKSDFDFFTAEHAQPAFDAEQEIMNTGKPILNLVEKETWGDGRVSYVSTSKMPLKNTEGKIIGTFGISRDVTETKLLEVNMEKREKVLTSLISITDENILLIDEDFQYQFISPAFGKKFNLDPLDVEGKKICGFVHSDDEEGLRNAMIKLKPLEQKEIKFRHLGESGKYENVEAIVKNFLQDEALQGYVFKIKNIVK